MNILKQIFTLVLGVLFDTWSMIATFFFWSLMNKVKQIMVNNFAEQLSSISYQINFFNHVYLACKKKTRYCLLFVSPNSNLTSSMNTTIAAIEAISLFIPTIFTPKRDQDKLLELLEFVFSFKHDENKHIPKEVTQ